MKRRIALVLLLAMLLSMLPVQAFAAEQEMILSDPVAQAAAAAEPRSSSGLELTAVAISRGSGTKEDPYLITSDEEFVFCIKNSVAGSYYSLTVDVDLNIYDNGHEFYPMGIAFHGILEGNGYTLRLPEREQNLAGDNTDGLVVSNAGTIRNLNISVPGREYTSEKNGVLAGSNTGLIENVHVVAEGPIIVNNNNFEVRDYYFGGIVGVNYATIKYCSFTGTIDYGALEYSVATGIYVGGIAGSGGTIVACEAYAPNGYADALIKVPGGGVPMFAGGIVGSGNVVENCAAVGSIYTWSYQQSYTGGIAGKISDTGSIKNCRALVGDLTAGEFSGGIVGLTKAPVSGCFAEVGYLTAQTGEKSEGYAGGIVGYCEASGIVNNCYANLDTIRRTTQVTTGSGCNTTTEWKDDGATTTHASGSDGNGSYTLTSSFIQNTLGWGLYKNYADTLVNPSRVWRMSGGDIYINYPDYLTIRYLDESGIPFAVGVHYLDTGDQYSIPSPESYGAVPESSVVSGTFSTHQKIDVKYGHAHVSETPATCTKEQVCDLCGAKMADKLPHSYQFTENVLPSCQGNGYNAYTCLACGDVELRDILEPTGHTLDVNYTCTVCNMQFEAPLRSYWVNVCDAETGIPLGGAEVTIGDKTVVTGTMGSAFFELDPKTEAVMTIQKDGYPDYRNEKFVLGDMPSCYIYLESEDTGIYGAWCNGDNVLLVDSQINCKSPALVAKITIQGRAVAHITGYELVQDGQVIANSSNGVFEVRNPFFKKNVPVYARMHTNGQNGHNLYERKLNICVTGFENTMKLDEIIPFLSDFDLEFNEDGDMWEGLSFKIPALALHEDGFFQFTAHNEKAMYTFGMEKDFFAEDLDAKSAKDIMKALRDKFIKQNSPSAWPKGKVKSEVTVSGAIVLEFNKKSEVSAAYGEVHIGYELSYKWGKTFVVWVVPIYAGFKAGLEGDLTMTKFGYDFENAEILFPDLEFSLSAEVAAFGGVGCSMVSAGVYGAIGGNFTVGLKDMITYSKYRLYGELGVYARLDLFFWKELEYRLPLMYAELVGPKVRSRVLSPESYTTATRSYLKNRSPWQNTALYGSGGDTYTLLQSSTYTGIKPQIAASGDQVLMLFMDDDGSAGYNYQHLYYSVYDALQGTWSTPKRVDNSACADLQYDVYADNSGIYVAYTKSGEITEANQNDYEQIMAGVEVYTARYNAVSGTFTDHTNVSCNDSFDGQPQITADAVVWLNNHTNDALGRNANNVLMLSWKTATGWQPAVSLGSNDATVASMDLGTLAGKTYIAMVRDVDCDLTTTDDRRVELMDQDGNSTLVATENLTNEGIHFTNVNGSNVVQWYSDGNIWQVSDAAQTPESLLEEAVPDLTGEFRTVQLDENNCVVLYVKKQMQAEIGGSSIYGIYCTDGQWGEPIALTEFAPETYIDSFDGYFLDGKLLMSYVATEATVTETDFSRVSSFMTSCLDLQNDLVAGDALILESQLFEGTNLQIEVPLTNLSMHPLKNVSVEVRNRQGTAVYSETVVLETALGSGAYGSVTVTVPKKDLSDQDQYTIQVSPNDWLDDDISNNAVLLSLWYVDFEVSARQMLQGDTLQVHYAATNSGNTAGEGQLQIYRKLGDQNAILSEDDQEEILYEEAVSLASGQSHTGVVPVTADWYDDGTSGTVYVRITTSDAELYQFNNELSLTVGELEKSTTEDITGAAEAVLAPFVTKPYVVYDRYIGGDQSFPITLNGWTFDGLQASDVDTYEYSDNALTLSESVIQSLEVGYHYFTLLFSKDGKQAEANLILEITDSTPAPAALTVEDVLVRYDGMPVQLTELKYDTPSSGAITSRYSNGSDWIDGLPTDVGSYTVELTVAADVEHNYGPATAQLQLTIVKGTRAISIPAQITYQAEGVSFDGGIPTADRDDGSIYYGYSTENDPSTVQQWTETGWIPLETTTKVYYLFARVTDSINYEDAVSQGYAVTAHLHQFTEQIEDEAHLVKGTGLNCQQPYQYYYDCITCDQLGEATFAGSMVGPHKTEYRNANGKHFLICTVENCDYTGQAEPCSGGEATCIREAICDVCQSPYGGLGGHALTHHSATSPGHTDVGNVEYWFCEVCRRYFLDEAAEQETSWDEVVLDTVPHVLQYVCTEAPTEETAGTLLGTCSYCSETETVTLPVLNKTDYTYKETEPPTCNRWGTAWYIWNNSEYGKFEFRVYVPNLGHDCPNVTLTKEPDRWHEGTLSGLCTRCGKQCDIKLPKLGTDEYTVVGSQEATCQSEGYRDYTWNNTTYGIYSFREILDKTGHSVLAELVTAPTHTETGRAQGTCDICQQGILLRLPALNASDYTCVVEQEPTCLSEGYGTYTWWFTDYGVFSFQATIPVTGHSYGYEVTQEPTSLATGILTGTCIHCGDITTVTLPELGSLNYTRETVQWHSCTQDGITTYVWNNTDYGEWTFTEVQPAAHSNSYHIEERPGPDWEGSVYRYCTYCFEGENVTLPPLNDTFYVYELEREPTCVLEGLGVYYWYYNGLDKVDDYYSFGVSLPVTDHSYDGQITVHPTCTAEGITTYTCSGCGDQYTQTIEITGHSYSYSVTAEPTLTETGVLQELCIHCSQQQEIILPSLNTTDYAYTVTAEATCVTDGVGVYALKDTIYSDFALDVTVTLPMTGHSYDQGQITLEPTCTEDGVKTYTCTVCGDQYTETVTATDHHYQNGACIDCGVSDPNGVALTGTVISYGSSMEPVTVCIYAVGSDTALHTLTTDNGSFTVMNLPVGDYRIVLSKINHVSREYRVTLNGSQMVLEAKLCLMGDVSGDGKVNMGDVAKLYAHIRKTALLTNDYQLLCANINGGSMNLGDVAMLYSHIKGTKKLY